jgi:hypothetical protein
MNVIKYLYDLKRLFDEYSFELVFLLCILFLILFSIYRKINGKKGSWSSKYSYLQNEDDKYRKDIFSSEVYKKPFFKGDSKGEVECRRVLEQIFKKPFNKARPNFLNNPVTGGNFNLELDCFNEELGLAVEYNGIQHYKFVSFFHKNNEAFLNQKYRDDMKRRICKEYKIILIEVPYTVKVEDIEDFLKNEIKKIYHLF